MVIHGRDGYPPSPTPSVAPVVTLESLDEIVKTILKLAKELEPQNDN